MWEGDSPFEIHNHGVSMLVIEGDKEITSDVLLPNMTEPFRQKTQITRKMAQLPKNDCHMPTFDHLSGHIVYNKLLLGNYSRHYFQYGV